MKKMEFIRKEVRFIIKNYMHTSLLVIIIFIPFLLSMIHGFQQDTSPPQIRNLFVELYLSPIIIFAAIPSIFPLLNIVNDEKKDKVFEQLFMTQLSPSKLLLYRFIALTPLTILVITVVYITTSVVVIIFAGDIYLSYILRGFISSLLFAISLGYVVFLNSMVMPSKYFPIFIMLFLFMAFLPIQSIYSIFGTTIGLFGLFTSSALITSIILTIIGVAETVILKNRIVELTITSQ